MLHRPDKVRVQQQLVCPDEEVVVDRTEIVKGFEYRKGEYVVIEPDEAKKIEPKTAKAMETLEFVEQGEEAGSTQVKFAAKKKRPKKAA